MRRASDLRAFLGSGSLVRVLLPRQSATRTSSARVAILRLGLGSYRAKIQPGANRSLGRSPNRATAICGGYLWWGLIPCCGGSSIIRRNILGWRSSWHGDHSRWWPLRSPTRWPASPGHCWPAAATTERHGLRQRVSKKGWPTGGEVASVRSRTARVMMTLMRNGRDRRSENPLRATRGKNACFCLGPISGSHQGQQPKRLHSKAEYMAAPERFAETSDSFPLHRGRRPYMMRNGRDRRTKLFLLIEVKQT